MDQQEAELEGKVWLRLKFGVASSLVTPQVW
jgi:hypothetical protein